jgi:hypothetical protein
MLALKRWQENKREICVNLIGGYNDVKMRRGDDFTSMNHLF